MLARLPCVTASALALLGAPLASRAQQGLYVEHRDAFHLVRAADRGRPYVDEKGKLVQATGSRYGLKPVEEFAPCFVSIRNLEAKATHIEVADAGAQINKTFHLRADFESPFGLENVFLVLDMNSEEAGKALFLWEIGRLEPRKPKLIELHVPVTVMLGQGKFRLHVFTDGREVFTSQQPWTFIERALDKMVARRVKDAPDGPPKPFVGPAPEYPAKLRRAKTKGEAVIACVISRNGRILEPQVARATDPAFGEAALAAARQWRFLPRVLNGAPAETKVNMPFVFSP